MYEWFDCDLVGCGGFAEYFLAVWPRTTLAFLHLKTVNQNASLEADLLDYAPNFEEVDGAYWFWVVRASVHSRTVLPRVLKFHIWIPHLKIFDTRFFFCPGYLPFWSYAPLKKSE